MVLPVTAKIDGSTVVVSAKKVKTPVAVRFAWKKKFIGNSRKEGLPVSSFRRDDWTLRLGRAAVWWSTD